MALNQDDTTGAVTGTYTVTGMLPVLSAGMIVPDINNFLSGWSPWFFCDIARIR
jgi:hypothetical protein